MEKHILNEQVIFLGSDIYGKSCSCGAIHPLDPKNLDPNLTLDFCTTCKGIKTLENIHIELHTLPLCKCSKLNFKTTHWGGTEWKGE